MFKTLIFFILISLISFNLSADQDKKEIKKDVTDTLHKDLQNRREKNKKKRFKKKPCNTAENCNLKYCKKARYCIERLPCNTTKNCKLKHCKRVKYCKDREVKKVKTPRYMPSQKTKNTNKVKKSKKRTKTQKVVGKLSEFAVMGIESETPTFFSLKTSYHFQHWAPDHIRGSKLDTNTINYFKFKVETFNDFFSIDYETSLGGTSLLKQKELIKLRSDSKTDWEKFLANVEIPYTMYAGKEKFRIYFAYSSEIFLSTLTMKEDKEYVPDTKSKNSVTVKKGERISSQTKFQDYYLGF